MWYGELLSLREEDRGLWWLEMGRGVAACRLLLLREDHMCMRSKKVLSDALYLVVLRDVLCV